jgi:3-methyladenine DNA glycosylase/8-oxoguanine DNA glycosylase
MAPLVAAVMSIAAPYLAKGAEEFAKSVGSAGFDVAKALMERLQKWWSKEPVAEAAAKALPSDPERYAKILGEELEHGVSKDESLSADLQKLVDAAGPYVEVIQKMDVAVGLTGADIGSLVSGHVRVQQDVRNAQNVTGFKATKVGGN